MEATALELEIRARIDQKTKPVGSLGFLEMIAYQVCMIQQTSKPSLTKPHIIVFAGDHGIAATGLVNPFPQAVTAQMVQNFLEGGAAINVFCRANRIGLSIVNTGVVSDLPDHPQLIQSVAGPGTLNYQFGPAMTKAQVDYCIQQGRMITAKQLASGTNLIGFGEMGIGNTSSASLLLASITRTPVAAWVGAGTGANAAQVNIKQQTLEQVFYHHNLSQYASDPQALLSYVGGYEIAHMVGAYLEATDQRCVICVDGFIATAALAVAQVINPRVSKFCLAAHRSAESGHRLALDWLGLHPILQLDMRLGEGTGAALAMPIVQSSVAFLNEMASFEEAGVSGKTS